MPVWVKNQDAKPRLADLGKLIPGADDWLVEPQDAGKIGRRPGNYHLGGGTVDSCPQLGKLACRITHGRQHLADVRIISEDGRDIADGGQPGVDDLAGLAADCGDISCSIGHATVCQGRAIVDDEHRLAPYCRRIIDSDRGSCMNHRRIWREPASRLRHRSDVRLCRRIDFRDNDDIRHA